MGWLRVFDVGLVRGFFGLVSEAWRFVVFFLKREIFFFGYSMQGYRLFRKSMPPMTGLVNGGKVWLEWDTRKRKRG